MTINDFRSVCKYFSVKFPCVVMNDGSVLYKRFEMSHFNTDSEISEVDYDENGVFVSVKNKDVKRCDANILQSRCTVGPMFCHPIEPEHYLFPLDLIYENPDYSCVMAELIEASHAYFTIPENNETYTYLDIILTDFEKRVMSNIDKGKGVLIIELESSSPNGIRKHLLKNGYKHNDFYFYKEIYKNGK